MKKIIFFGFLAFGFFTLVTAPSIAEAASTACTKTSGNITSSQFAGGGSMCSDNPDYYGIRIYEMGLCKTTPGLPAIGTAFNKTTGNCTDVFSSASGAAIEVQNGISSTLPGPFTRPTNGNYTYGYVILDNVFSIKTVKQFTASMTAPTTNSGVYCWTVTSNNSAATTFTPASVVDCGAAAATPGTVTEYLRSFSSPGVTSFSTAITGGTITGYLVKTDNSLVTAINDVANTDKIIATYAFSNPISITTASTTFNAGFGVSNGLSVISTPTNIVSLLSGPFSLRLSIK